MEIIIALAAIIIGLAVGYLFGVQKANGPRTEVEVLKSKLQESQRQMEQNLQLQRQHEADSLEAMQGRFDETIGKMRAEIESVTSRLLKERQAEFASESSKNMSQILEPLNVNLKLMREAVNENTNTHSKLGGELANNLQMVMRHSDAARQSAERLAEALKGGGKIQGDWGETILKELLESQNLKEGIHFETQTTITDRKGNTILSEESGSKMRPDVILHLDGRRDVVIDSKVSLTAFMDYVAAETEEQRAIALKKHIDSIEKHVKELAEKNYSSYILPPKTSVDYVIMFVPTSAALYVATQAKNDLWRSAMNRGVYIADEQTLYAALKIIDMTWRQIAQAQNHQKVYTLASEMLDRVGAFMSKFTAIGSKLADAEKSYKEALAKLEDRGQSIPVTCNKLIKMGAKPKKQPKGVAPELLGIYEDSDDDELLVMD